MLTQTRNLADVDPTTQPKLPPLPNPLFFFVRVFLYLSLAFVVLPLAVLPFSLEGGLFCELFGVILGFSMLLSALISSFVAWRVSRRLKRFRDGDFLAHWTYTREEWLTFAEGEWQRRRRDAGQGPRLGLLIGGLCGLVFGYIAASVLYSSSVLPVVLGVLAGGVLFGLLGALIGWLGGWAARFAAWRSYQRMQERVGETYIGADAAYCSNCYWSWTMPNFELAGMELIPGRPAVLLFNLRVYMPKGGVAIYPYRAPVPQGREEEARWILRRLCAA